MQGSLGEKIGEGAYSEAYAWAPGQVVKLFKPGLPRRMAWFEVHMLRAVHAAGAPVAEVFGEVTLDGRYGIVLQRLDGPSPAALADRRGDIRTGGGGCRRSCHVRSPMPPPPEVLSMRDYIRIVGSTTASLSNRHGYPCPDRSPAARRQPLPLRP